MGEIPMTEEEEAELKAEQKAEMAAKKPVLPAQSQSGGLVSGLKKQEVAAGKKATAANEDAELKSKIGGGQVGLNLKGMNGAQKWRAALEKVEEVEGAKYDVSLNGSLVHVVGELEPNPQERLADPVFKVTWLIGECSLARARRKKTTKKHADTCPPSKECRQHLFTLVLLPTFLCAHLTGYGGRQAPEASPHLRDAAVEGDEEGQRGPHHVAESPAC